MNGYDLSPTLCPDHPRHCKHSWGFSSLRPFTATKATKELWNEGYDQLPRSQPQSSEVQKSLG